MRRLVILSLLCAVAPAASAQTPARPLPSAPPTPAGAPRQPFPAAQNVFSIFSMATEAVQEPRVDLDFENTPVRDAFKRLFEQAGRSYQLDADVPDSARITLKAKNVRFSTALELLLQSAGLGVGHQIDNGKLSYRIQKGGPDTVSATGLLRSVIEDRVREGKPLDPSAGNLKLPDPFQHLGQVKDLYTTVVPYVLNFQEMRSTFRCPHCKGQATVIRKPGQPKCEKCNRLFQPGWKFCPDDGTKRPAPSGEWNYCPFCSKKVEGEQSQGETPALPQSFLGQYFSFPGPAPLTIPAPPVQSRPASPPTAPASTAARTL
jgi:hypothetical protein